MRNKAFALALAFALVGLTGPTSAQYCPDPVLITCGDTVQGNNQNGPDVLTEYSCINYTWTGPENHYRLVVPECSDLTMTVSPQNFDAALLVLGEYAGLCLSNSCLVGADDGNTGYAETIQASADAGEYFVVVDGYGNGGYGDYTLDVQCTPHPECVDADGDGFLADDGVCPCGNDCDDSDPDRSPAQAEICGDGIDQDCDGADPSCPACNQTDSLVCPDSGSTNMGALTNHISAWCGSSSSWTGREAVFGLTMDKDAGIHFTTSAIQDIDVIVVLPFADGVCNPDACLTNSLNDYTGDEEVFFYGSNGQTYFIVADGYGGASPTFDWEISCLDETCSPGAPIACGQSLSGNSDTGTNDMTVYPGRVYEFPADEEIHTFTPAGDSQVAIQLSFNASLDLALIILEDDGNGCSPAYMVALSDLDNANYPSVESVSFQAAAGATYYVVVDGWLVGEQGTYDLQVSCSSTCPDGTTACGAECVDTQTDMDHCGACNTPCAPAHASADCQAGACVILSCDAGWSDCNSDVADGCEADLTSDATCGDCATACTSPEFCFQGGCTDQCPQGLTNCLGTCIDTSSDPANCGGCDQPCSFDHAEALCVNSSCALGTCQADWGDCNTDPADGCETDTSSDPVNCGGCGAPCGAGLFCVQGSCTDQCPQGLTNCDGTCVDTDTDLSHCGGCHQPCAFDHAAAQCAGGTCSIGACEQGFADCGQGAADGCETALGDLQNCTACSDACSWANGAGQCTPAGCEFTACDAGYADCNSDLGDGCEAALGSAQHCSGCNDACDFDNADGACVAGACQLGACWANFEDCDADQADGCEADLRSNATCGSCDLACQPTETCDQGACVSSCQDLDGDGYPASSCGGTDCNDYDPDTHPGAAEVCGDGLDQDCNGSDLPCGNCQDLDNDGYQDSACGGSDCNDGDAGINPGAAEICGDWIDQDCNGSDLPCGGCHDNDGDGFEDWTCGGADCDDSSSFINPNAAEICGDGIDQNCDGQDEACGCVDADGDGHAPVSCGGLDCDDTNPSIHPGAIDDCGDGIDQNCDGQDRPCPGGGSGCGCATGSQPMSLSILLGLLALVEYRRRRHR